MNPIISLESKSEGKNEQSTSLPMESSCVHEGRKYRHKERYSSGAEVLPDILFNLMEGYGGEQSYKLYSGGLRQGMINVTFLKSDRFEPKPLVCGSFEVSALTVVFWKFMKNPALEKVFGLKDQRARECIQRLFEEVLKGSEKCEINFGKEFSVEADIYPGWMGLEFFCESKKYFDVVADFFHDIDIKDFFHKI